MLPPFFMKIRIVEKGKNKVRLWFPMFLIWLLLLALAIAIAPFVLVAALILWPWKLGKKLLMFGPMFFFMLGSLNGLDIQVGSLHKQVSISFK